MQPLDAVLGRLVKLMRRLWASEAPSMRSSGIDDRFPLPAPTSFEDQIAARANNPENVLLVAGALDLIGLAELRDRIGDDWNDVARDIRTVVEEEIRAALEPNDVFRCVDDVTYLICFSSQDEAASDRAAKALSTSIRARISTAFPVLKGTVVVESTTSSVNPGKLIRGGSLTDNLLAVLRRVREDMRQISRQQRSSVMRRPRVHFLPAVTPLKHQFTLNSCILDTRTGIDGLSQYRALADAEDLDETMAELDLCLLTRAIEALHNAVKKGPCAPLLVPVNIKTLTNTVHARQYGVLAGAIPERYRALVALELIGLSPGGTGFSGARADLLSEIPISRLAMQVPLERQPMDERSTAGLWAVSVSLAGRTSTEPVLSSLLQAIANNASRLGLLTIAHDANSLGLARLTAESRFNFIDGLAIALPCPSPKPPLPAPATLFGVNRTPLRERR